jgi:hypothetical protein
MRSLLSCHTLFYKKPRTTFFTQSAGGTQSACEQMSAEYIRPPKVCQVLADGKPMKSKKARIQRALSVDSRIQK